MMGKLTKPAGNLRSVHEVISTADAHLGRMPLKRIINGDHQRLVSPFFMVDEFGPMQLSPGAPFRVDAHPHAGIIPTTYLLEGNAHHRDSMDNDFQYRKGEFIQFTSGKGALHMEETGDELYWQGGVFHGIQGWLNLPNRLKKIAPDAGHFTNEDIRVVETEGATIRVILGDLFGVSSKVRLAMPVIYWHVLMAKGATLELPVDAADNIFLYLLQGQVDVGNQRLATKGQTVLFERDGDVIRFTATMQTSLLALGGESNEEAYVAHGPFVMANEQDLRQAYVDFEQGKFGNEARTNGASRR